MKIYFQITILLPILFFSIAYPNMIYSQLPEKYGYFEQKIITLNDTVSYFIYGNKATVIKQKKPVLIYLQGSGAKPVFELMPDGSLSSSLMLSPEMVGEKYHFIVIGKPCIKFVDSVKTAVPKQYYRLMNYDYRVRVAGMVIDDLFRHTFVDTSKVVLVGHSEGGQIAPGIALSNHRVTHIACLSGTAINQIYDFVLNIRKKEFNGEISHEEAALEMDSIYFYYREILEDPTSTTKFFAGHTYLKWSTTFDHPPLDVLLKLDIPVYIVAAGKDEAAPVEHMDMIPIAFIEKKKTNLTYKAYPLYDHTYNELVQEENGKYTISNHIDRVMFAMLEWLENN